MNTVFIHGYAVGIKSSLRKRDEKLGGFEVFSEEINDGSGHLFYWAKPVDLSWAAMLNLPIYFKHYWQERQLAGEKQTHLKLKKVLEKKLPDRIICHSMGCYLLAQYVQRYPLPKSVKSVVFLQADCTKKELMASGLLAKHIQFLNIYRLFDPTLFGSSVLHRSWRLGVRPAHHPKVKNIHFSSFSHGNLHVAVLNDKRIKKVLQAN